VHDLAAAVVHLMRSYDEEGLVNIGWGEDLTIRELAQLVADVVGYAGRIEFDASKPDGTPRKLLDTSRLTALGWRPRIGLRAGLESTYHWYLEHLAEARN
jgi:GDP-L-fucose synthase